MFESSCVTTARTYVLCAFHNYSAQCTHVHARCVDFASVCACACGPGITAFEVSRGAQALAVTASDAALESHRAALSAARAAGVRTRRVTRRCAQSFAVT